MDVMNQKIYQNISEDIINLLFIITMPYHLFML